MPTDTLKHKPQPLSARILRKAYMEQCSAKTTVAFMQVGFDKSSEIFVDSLRKKIPDAEIIQCSDLASPAVNGVSRVFRMRGNTQNLMTFRLQIFSALNLDRPAIYLDNDMLILQELQVESLLGDNDVANCERYFNREDTFNIDFKNMNLTQYTDKKLFEVYPILACFTVARSYQYWARCLEILEKLDKKFHFWYGDQEAMRILADLGEFKVRYLSEARVACLPEFFSEYSDALALHFKGPRRKRMLNSFHEVSAGT